MTDGRRADRRRPAPLRLFLPRVTTAGLCLFLGTAAKQKLKSQIKARWAWGGTDSREQVRTY